MSSIITTFAGLSCPNRCGINGVVLGMSVARITLLNEVHSVPGLTNASLEFHLTKLCPLQPCVCPYSASCYGTFVRVVVVLRVRVRGHWLDLSASFSRYESSDHLAFHLRQSDKSISALESKVANQQHVLITLRCTS